jgi:hypothetical protein
MKADRRHELKENELAHYLTEARNWLDRNSQYVTWGLVGLLAVIIVVGFTSRSRGKALSGLWQERQALDFGSAEAARGSIRQLIVLSGKTKDDAFAVETLKEAANRAMLRVVDENGAVDKEFNDLARSAANELLAHATGAPLVFAFAHCTLARAEANAFLLDQDPQHQERARTHLNAVLENTALRNTPFQKLAADQLNQLGEDFQVIAFAPPAEPMKVKGASGTVTVDSDQPIQVRNLPKAPIDITPQELVPPTEPDNEGTSPAEEPAATPVEDPAASPIEEPAASPIEEPSGTAGGEPQGSSATGGQ